MRRPLRTLKKAELIEYLASVVLLLTKNQTGDNSYVCGWRDSRKAILIVTGLDKLYDIEVTMEDRP